MLRRAVLLGDGQADRFQQRRDLPLDGPGLGGDPLDVPGQAIARGVRAGGSVRRRVQAGAAG
ncbi:hypothetical protein ACQCP8_20640, partial [Ralstonia pseudosolanacearum]|uniref:hypothetical protein n=1 Tax=Ralstonia pseudosolanacearum TaxID=1310165 RepID=UPI003CE85AB3